MQFGQPLFGAAQFSFGQTDLLTPSAVAANTGSAQTVLNLAALSNYTALEIHVHNPGGASVADAIWAMVQGPSPALTTFSGAFPSQPTVAAVGLSDVITYIGCANNIGDTLQVTVQFAAAPPVGTTITVVGLTNAPPMNRRPDGRNFPEGALYQSSAIVGAGVLTLIPAPTQAQRILLSYLTMSCNGAGSSTDVTITGVTGHLVVLEGLGSILFPIPPGGMLLDPGTAVSVNGVAGSNTFAAAAYDIVAA